MEQTHWKQNFDYKFTGAYELEQGQTKVLTIKRICREGVKSENGEEKLCMVAYFNEESKPMVLNKTNCKTIEKLYTPFVENWAGKRIAIESKKVKAFGEFVDALRVKKLIPESNQKPDYSVQTTKIKSCKTLDELKAVFTSLQPKEKAALEDIKDEMKDLLSNGIESR